MAKVTTDGAAEFELQDMQQISSSLDMIEQELTGYSRIDSIELNLELDGGAHVAARYSDGKWTLKVSAQRESTALRTPRPPMSRASITSTTTRVSAGHRVAHNRPRTC